MAQLMFFKGMLVLYKYPQIGTLYRVTEVKDTEVVISQVTNAQQGFSGKAKRPNEFGTSTSCLTPFWVQEGYILEVKIDNTIKKYEVEEVTSSFSNGEALRFYGLKAIGFNNDRLLLDHRSSFFNSIVNIIVGI